MEFYAAAVLYPVYKGTYERGELDHQKIAYYGYSWGAALGSIVPAVEPRIRICVLALGGLGFERSLPEVEEINFLSRVKQPVLMLNGRYDFYFPEQSSQDPFYQRLERQKNRRSTSFTKRDTIFQEMN